MTSIEHQLQNFKAIILSTTYSPLDGRGFIYVNAEDNEFGILDFVTEQLNHISFSESFRIVSAQFTNIYNTYLYCHLDDVHFCPSPSLNIYQAFSMINADTSPIKQIIISTVNSPLNGLGQIFINMKSTEQEIIDYILLNLSMINENN